MKKNTRLIIVMSFVLLMVGCASTPIIDVASIPLQEMKLREGVVVDELSKKIDSSREHRGRAQVVVVDFSNGGNQLASTHNVGNSAMHELKQAVTEAGAELVDRGLVNRLKEEIRLIEISGESKYRATAQATIAIKGKITAANYTSSFSEANVWTDKKGKTHHTPARCNYIGEAEAIISFYNMNPLSLKENISIEGRHRNTSDTTNENCPLNNNELASLLAEATEKAIKQGSRSIKSHFSPRGYIDEFRQSKDGDINIFRTTMSPQIGASPGNEVKIWRDVSYTNQLGREINERSVVAEGKVIEAAGGSVDAWIKVYRNDEADLVMLGDTVEVDYKDPHTTLENVVDGFYNLMDDLQ